MNAWTVSARSLRDVDHVIEEQARRLVLSLDRPDDDAEAMLQLRVLKKTLEPHLGGACDIRVEYRIGDTVAPMVFGKEWRVRASRELRLALAALDGATALHLAFALEP